MLRARRIAGAQFEPLKLPLLNQGRELKRQRLNQELDQHIHGNRGWHLKIARRLIAVSTHRHQNALLHTSLLHSILRRVVR